MMANSDGVDDNEGMKECRLSGQLVIYEQINVAFTSGMSW